MSKKGINPANFISPININGLDGRVLSLKAVNKKNKKEVLVVYDLKSNLERWWGLDSALSHYANVTAVDLPGLGGMDSFYTIGLLPTINNYAEYLEAYVKLRYKRKKLFILAIGFGFVVATRMLQRNPDIASKVTFVISINGYAHHDDLKLTDGRQLKNLAESLALSLPLVPWLAKTSLYSSPALSYRQSKLAKNNKLDNFTINFMLDLDKETDIRTSKYIYRELAKLDNCGYRVALPLWHVTTGNQRQYLNPSIVEQHLRVVFTKYRLVPSKLSKVPNIVSDARTGIKLLPAALRRELKKPVR